MPPSWNTETLQRMHITGDPEADALIQGIAESGPEGLREFSALLHVHGPMDLSRMPKSAQDFIESQSRFPDWTDWEKIHLGQSVFSRYGLEISLLFYFKSLPSIYSCPRIADVFYQSYSRDPSPRTYARQLMGIAQFIVDVLTPGGFSESGNAIQGALKARLIHALIRYYMDHRKPQGPDFAPGINQVDMAIPILTSTTLLLDGLPKLGIQLSDQEAEAYTYCWRLATHFIGVLPDLVPKSVQEARQITDDVLKAHIAPNTSGVELTQLLCTLFNSMGPQQYLGLGPEALIRFYAGTETAQRLGLGNGSGMISQMVPQWWNNSLSIMGRLQRNLPVIGGMAREMNPFLLQKTIDYMRGQ